MRFGTRQWAIGSMMPRRTVSVASTNTNVGIIGMNGSIRLSARAGAASQENKFTTGDVHLDKSSSFTEESLFHLREIGRHLGALARDSARFLSTTTTRTNVGASAMLVLGSMLLLRKIFGGGRSSSSSSSKQPPPVNEQLVVVRSDSGGDRGDRPPQRRRPQRPHPLGPEGVNTHDVEALVQACLKDPKINIQAIPDWLEKQLYVATIKLTLNSLYKALGGIHGRGLLGYSFELHRAPRIKARLKQELCLLSQTTDEQERVLEQVADRLLANKNINQPLIPDALERQLYTNCLKIVFRVLNLVAVSFRVTLCGHDLNISLEPSAATVVNIEQEAMARIAASPTTMSDIDMERMKELAREMGASDEDLRWFWQRWTSPANNEFVAQIHASVYCLILGVLDDLLSNTEIRLLSDRIRFDLVPDPDDDSDDETSSQDEDDV